jgi:hypothetical protein
MFEGASAILATWRGILHVSEWTGLSAGAIAALAALVYLRPALLKPAIVAAAAVALTYGGVLYGHRAGRAEVKAEWDAARAAAGAAATKRDSDIRAELEKAYGPQLEALRRLSAANAERADTAAAEAQGYKTRAEGYEQKLLGHFSKRAPPAGACELGAAAERVPKRGPSR